MGSANTIKDMARMAICLALICVSAYIAVPVPFAAVVVSAVTLSMNLAAFLLTPMQTFVVLVSYVLLGVAGLPVLDSCLDHPAVFLSPSVSRIQW